MIMLQSSREESGEGCRRADAADMKVEDRLTLGARASKGRSRRGTYHPPPLGPMAAASLLGTMFGARDGAREGTVRSSPTVR